MNKAAIHLMTITTLLAAPSVWATPIFVEFLGVAETGSRTGSTTYSGAFSFDDAPLVGVGDEFLTVDSFSMTWTDSSTFNEVYELADVFVEAVFFDGLFLGLAGGSLAAPVVDFQFIPGFFDINGAFFAYGTDGTGDLPYERVGTGVPAPATAPLLLLGLALLGAFSRNASPRSPYEGGPRSPASNAGSRPLQA